MKTFCLSGQISHNYAALFCVILVEGGGFTAQEVGLYFALFLSFLTLVGLMVAIVYFYWSKTGTEALKEDLTRSRARYDDLQKDLLKEQSEHNATRAEMARTDRRLKACEDREEDEKKKELRTQGKESH